MRFNSFKYLAVLPLALGLTQCDIVEAIHNPKPKDGPYTYDLILKVSPKAEAALKTTDTVFADALYYGHAKPEHSADADRLNRLVLGRERWLFPASTRKIHMFGSPLDAKKLPRTTEGEPMVLVTVEGSGEPGTGVTCSNYIGTVRAAREKSPVLRCELPSEHYWRNVSADDAADSSAGASGQ